MRSTSILLALALTPAWAQLGPRAVTAPATMRTTAKVQIPWQTLNELDKIGRAHV